MRRAKSNNACQLNKQNKMDTKEDIYDEMEKHFSQLRTHPINASIEHFLETGKISGTFRTVIESYIPTPPTRTVTDAEIKRKAREFIKVLKDQINQNSRNGKGGIFLYDGIEEILTKWALSQMRGLLKEGECNHDCKEHTFDGKPDQRLCPITVKSCKRDCHFYCKEPI